MEFLKSFISFGVLTSIIYFIGAFLVEIGALHNTSYLIPRTRKKLYIIRAYSFFEYVFFFIIIIIIFIQSQNKNSFILSGIIFVLYLIRLFLAGNIGKRVSSWLKKNRLHDEASNIVIFIWIGLSFYTYNLISAANYSNYLYGPYAFYIFLIIIQIREFIDPKDLDIKVTIINKKNEVIIKNKRLLDETNDFFVIFDGNKKNILVNKSEIDRVEIKIDS